MEISYQSGIIPDTTAITALYDDAGLKRPTSDNARITRMYANSNLVITAWHDGKLVGVSRSLTDFCYCCYLSDLAVAKAYQARGIGKRLIELTKEHIGAQTTLILLSAPTATEYYPKVGFQKIENGFLIPRAT